MIRLAGECNFCGACCLGKDGSRCEHLKLFTAVGMPNATMCGKYKERYNGMPITMLARDGSRIEGRYHCALNSLAETLTIIEMGIQRGVCSLRIEEEKKNG